MTNHSDGWKFSDEWFADFIAELEASPRRRKNLRRERILAIPVKETLQRQFEDETEQLRRYLEGERLRWLRLTQGDGPTFMTREIRERTAS